MAAVSAVTPVAVGVTFREQPLAFVEDAAEERERVMRLRREDPITLQDAVNTSRALVDAVKDGDLEELQSIVSNAEEGEFLQAFTLQAFVLSLKSGSLTIVQQLVAWGIPLQHTDLSQAIHLVCEITNRDNFSDAWRIVQLLTDGNAEGSIDINTPRIADGWTPLCIACADACLPLAFKLLELGADPNVITRANATPISLVKQKRAEDSEEQQEARGIISNMLRAYGGEEKWRDALSKQRCTKKKVVRPPMAAEEADEAERISQQTVSISHTRFTG
jgi:hypothetical protein